MRRIWIFATALILCMFLCGHGCKKAQEEPKGKIKEEVMKEDAGSFEEEVGEEAEKIPAPAEEWGGEPEDPML